jgi:hypothetical protein
LDKWIELAKALGWPIAVVVIAIVLLLVVLILNRKLKNPQFHIRGPQGWEFKAGEGESHALTADSAAKVELAIGSDVATAAEIASSVKPDGEAGPSDVFYVTKDASRLSALFDEFKSDAAYKEDPDFWETLYVRRRRELGLGGTNEEYIRLYKDHNTWVWPLINLVRRSIEVGDFASGEGYLIEALTRSRSQKHQAYVLEAGLSLYNMWKGKEGCLSFVSSVISEGQLTDKETSDFLISLADEIKDGDGDSSSLQIREIALRYDPSNRDNRSYISYQYLSNDDCASNAAFHLMYLINDDATNDASLNNLGVIFEKYGEDALVIEHYVKAAEHGSAISVANIAGRLISHGFLYEAEQQLGSIVNEGDATERVLEVRKSLASAKKKSEQRFKKIQTRVRREYALVQAVVGAGFSYWKDKRAKPTPGDYISAHGTIHLTTEIATVQLDATGIKLSGGLQFRYFSYEGTLTTDPNNFLGATYRRATLCPISDTSVRILVYPATASGDFFDATFEIISMPPLLENNTSAA